MRTHRGSYQTRFGSLRVFDAKVQNANEILKLFRAVVCEGKWMATSIEELERTVIQQEEIIYLCSEQENCCYMEGYIDKKLIGAMSVWGGDLARNRHVGTLEIFLDSQYRGGGVGGAMMDALILWGHNNPAIEKLVLSVFCDNEPAIKLYKKLGFVVEGCAIGDFREKDGRFRDRLMMARWCP